MKLRINIGEYLGPEIAAAFYLSSFTILKPLLQKYSYVSSSILLIELFCLIIISVIGVKGKIDGLRVRKVLCLFLFVTFVFLIDFVFRRNQVTWYNYYYFLIYGIGTALLMLNVYNISRFLKYWCFFAVVAGLMMATDPINRYAISGDYMNFGSAMLPSYAACLIWFFYYKKRIALPFVVVFFVEILLFAHKGAAITAVVLTLFFIIMTNEDKNKRIKRTIMVACVGLVAILSVERILGLLTKISMRIGVGSYSLTGFYELFSASKMQIINVRTQIWSEALTEIGNHFLFGMGIGGFEVAHGNQYAHNFILDILVSHGIILGAVVFLVIGKWAYRAFKVSDKDLFILSCAFFILWFFPMMFSFTFWRIHLFWSFIIIGMFFLPKQKEYDSSIIS